MLYSKNLEPPMMNYSYASTNLNTSATQSICNQQISGNQVYYNPHKQDIIQGIVSRIRPTQESEYVTQQMSIQNNNQNYQNIHVCDHRYVLHEVHHIQRPVETTDFDKVTTRWKARELVLLREIRDLEQKLRTQIVKPEKPKHDYVKLKNRHFELRLEIDEINEKLLQRKQDKDALCIKKDQIIDQLSIVESGGGKIGELSNELDDWKKKFVGLNRQFHQLQEKLTLAQAEVESILKRKTVVVQQVVTK